ncbi:hypothetical protein V8E54_005874 [Elaphomyces granulatus]
MSSTLSHSMEHDLIDNAFLAMMLQLLQESQLEEVPNKPRQSRSISRALADRHQRPGPRVPPPPMGYKRPKDSQSSQVEEQMAEPKNKCSSSSLALSGRFPSSIDFWTEAICLSRALWHSFSSETNMGRRLHIRVIWDP